MKKVKQFIKSFCLLTVAFISAASPSLALVSVKASTPSLWVTSSPPSLTIDEEPASSILKPIHDFCKNTVLNVLTKVNNLPTPQPREECVVTTSYGMLGRDFLQYSNTSVALKSEIANGFGHPLLLPNTDQLFYTVVAGGQKFLSAYANPISKLIKQPGNSSWPSMYKTTAPSDPDWSFVDQSNNSIITRQIAASKNGRWMLVEVPGGIVRIDLQTKEFFKFTSEVPPYGIGHNPTLHLAISNDGRYAAVAGSRYSGLRLYDLSTCIAPNTPHSLTLATGCGRQDLTDFLKSKYSGFAEAFYLEFSNDASQISMRATAPGKAAMVTLTAAGQTISQLDYLAMGDSFSSGEGDNDTRYYEPGTNKDAPQQEGLDASKERCHTSTRSYPYLLASRMSVATNKFKSLACSGAILNDILNESDADPSQNGYTGHFDQLTAGSSELRRSAKDDALEHFKPGRASQIEFVEKYKPKIITISIGGNDVGFGDKIGDCGFNISAQAVCEHASSEAQRALDANEYANMYLKLKSLYQTIHEKSPKSKVYVIGYPSFVGDKQLCVDQSAGLNQSEREYINQSISYFNSIIKGAAESAGVKYLDIQDALTGHRLCDSDTKTNAVNGQWWEPFGDVHGLVNPGSFHPTPAGHALIANKVNQESTDLFAYDVCPQTANTNDVYCPTPNNLPSTPSYFQYSSANKPNFFQWLLAPLSIIAQGTPSAVRIEGLAPASTLTLELHSEPIQLGTLTTSATGSADATFTIPNTVAPGHHTLHIFGTAPSGEKLDLYQSLLVLGPDADKDSDGVPDTNDPCLFVPAANIDYDKDGIDDACDGLIGDPPADSVSPVVTGVADRQPNDHSWYKDSVTISWTAADPDPSSGAATTPPPTIADREGTHTYTSEPSCDPAGNCATGSVTLNIDRTLPTITQTLSTPPNSAGWHNADVMISADCNDPLSSILSCDAPFNKATEGHNQAVTHIAKDKAGNENSATSTINLDKTPPILSSPTWTNNPKTPTSTSSVHVAASDDLSAIEEAEYFLGDNDPGQGNGATMSLNGGELTTTFGTNFPTGVYKVSIRAKDFAGNWSTAVSDYLVVQSSAGTRMSGKRTIVPSLLRGDILPGLISNTQDDVVKFGFNVHYTKLGLMHQNSDFQLSYKTGTKCNNPAKASNCHELSLNSLSMHWLSTQGFNNSIGMFQGTASLEVDGVKRNVIFRLWGLDGELLSPTSQDYIEVKVYNSAENPNSAQPIFQATGEVLRGNIKIKVQ